VAYALKLGIVVLGAWIWRNADRSDAVQEQITDEQSRRAWIPVVIAGALVIGIVSFIATSALKDARLRNQLAREPAPAAWASDRPTLWPDLVLMQKAGFSHHTALETGCACLVRLPTGEICALTAAHLLGNVGGVKPSFVHDGFGGLDKEKLATLDSEITSWKLFLPDAENQPVNVIGLYGDAKQFDENCDQVLLRLAITTNEYPATPLDLRLSPVTINETLYVLTYDWDDNGRARQVVHKAHRVPGMGFNCAMETPAELNGFSGAPIVDKNGLLVGILTGGSVLDINNASSSMHAFTGHLAKELMPVLEEAVAVKGAATLTPIKTISKTPVQTGNTSPAKPAGDTI
jgi:hypothetical protein